MCVMTSILAADALHDAEWVQMEHSDKFGFAGGFAAISMCIAPHKFTSGRIMLSVRNT
jgi:hypothetical protein